jgi:hypothetical protein
LGYGFSNFSRILVVRARIFLTFGPSPFQLDQVVPKQLNSFNFINISSKVVLEVKTNMSSAIAGALLRQANVK